MLLPSFISIYQIRGESCAKEPKMYDIGSICPWHYAIGSVYSIGAHKSSTDDIIYIFLKFNFNSKFGGGVK